MVTEPEIPVAPVLDPSPPPARRPRVLSVGAGKGGVGKTFLVANLAAVMAREGLQVVAVDTDLGAANLHTWLGVARPRASLADFVVQRERDLAKLVLETPVHNLGLIAATEGPLAGSWPRSFRRVKLLQALRRLPADVVLVDLAGGSHPPVLDYFLVGDDGLLAFIPEPTSMENAYEFLRAAFYRRLRLTMTSDSMRRLVNQAMDERKERGIRTPLDLLREVEALHPEEGRRFAGAMRRFRPRLIVNSVRTAQDIRLGFAVRSVCRKYFGLDAEYLGYVNADAAVREAVLVRRPLVESHPESDAAVYLTRIARKLIGMARISPALAAQRSPA